MPVSLAVVIGTSGLVAVAAWPLLRHPRQALAPGLPLALLPVAVAALAGGVETVRLFRRIAATGSGGAGLVASALTNWTEGMLVALFVAVAITTIALLAEERKQDDGEPRASTTPAIWIGFVVAILVMVLVSAALVRIAERTSVGTLARLPVPGIGAPPSTYENLARLSPIELSRVVSRDLLTSIWAGGALMVILLVLVVVASRGVFRAPAGQRAVLPATACITLVVLGWATWRLSWALGWLHGFAEAAARRT